MNYLNEAQGLRGPFLVIAPLSTVQHWKREFQNFTNLHPVVYHAETAAGRRIIRETEFYVRKDPSDVLVGCVSFCVCMCVFQQCHRH